MFQFITLDLNKDTAVGKLWMLSILASGHRKWQLKVVPKYLLTKMNPCVWMFKFVVILGFIVPKLVCDGIEESLESKLMKELTSVQSPAAFPNLESDKPVNLTFSITLRRILNVNDRSHIIKTRIWVRQRWRNEFLVWNASQWGNIQSMNFPAALVWLPDTVLYNSVDAETFPGGTELYKTAVLGYSNGMQNWYAPVTLETSCTIDVRYFPFDEQTCPFHFGSWSNHVGNIDLYPDTSDIIFKNFIEGAEWKLVKTSTDRVVKKYDCCPDKFVTIYFYITIKRKATYYTVTLIIPCLMVLPLTIVSFLLPPESGERIGLTITILLAVAVFLQLTSEILPKFSKNTPYLSLFFFSTMSVTTLSLFVTGFVLLLHFKGSTGGRSKMPGWIRKYLVTKLGRFLMIKELKKLETNNGKQKANSLTYHNGFVKSVRTEHDQKEKEKCNPVELIDDGSLISGDSPTGKELEKCEKLSSKLLHQILEHVTQFSAHLKDTEREDNIAKDWRLLAMVVDRLLLVIFTIVSFILSIIFLSPIYSR